MSPSPMQLLIVLVIVLVLFGASRLGDLGKGLGEGIRNFKKGVSDEDKEKAKQAKNEDDSGDDGQKES